MENNNSSLEILKEIKEQLDGLKKNVPALFEEERKRPHVKNFKSANNKSTLDVSSALHYWKENAKGEKVYKGSMIFGITEHEKGKKSKFLQAFLPKDKVKVLMAAIMEGRFSKDNNGSFINYGMKNEKELKHSLRSRVLKINLSQKGQYVFTIDDSPGKEGKTGNIMPAGDVEKSVTRYVPQEEAIRMAREVLDYIRDQELIGQLRGKPLQTIGQSNFEESSNQNQSKTKKETMERPKEERKEKLEDYIIQVDPWKGKKISELKAEELKFIATKTKERTEGMAKELHIHALKEIKRRMDEVS
jgi:hypothetical protein